MEVNQATITGAIDDQTLLLNDISDKIWTNPELCYEEHKAHCVLTSALQKIGFSVQRSYLLPTAFRAEFDSGRPGPVAAVLCEYDALPGIGHGCGHNLIAETGLGAAIGIRAALQKGKINGKVVCLGTPAEEGGGGKIKMIAKGAFKDIDFCMMAHPWGGPQNNCFPLILSMIKLKVQYFGKESHASCFPWDGINALDAVVAAYSNISMLRQQMKPDWRVHSVITNGGLVPNIIPAETEMQCQIRAPNRCDLQILEKKVKDCFSAAAQSTGCNMKFTEDNSDAYDNLLTNSKMAEVYMKYAHKVGGLVFSEYDSDGIKLAGSTDMGNVSKVVPSIHPIFNIGATSPLHSKSFTQAARTDEAERHTKVIAKTLALTAVELMTDPKLLIDVKKEFEEKRLS